LQRYPQIQALSFQRLLMDTDRPAYETMMRRRFADFTITEISGGQQRRADRRDSYNVVDYIEPKLGNDNVLGLDTSMNPDQIETRNRSRATGKVMATGLFSLAQHQGPRSGFLVLAPVYLRGVPLDSEGGRSRAAIGETAAVFRSDHLITPILRVGGFATIPGMAIRIYASDRSDPQNMATQDVTTPSAAESRPLFEHWLVADQYPPVSTAFTLAGQPWHIEITQSSQPFTVNHYGSLSILLAGIR
jgi:CHASE1-domain containing sensor protein